MQAGSFSFTSISPFFNDYFLVSLFVRSSEMLNKSSKKLTVLLNENI